MDPPPPNPVGTQASRVARRRAPRHWEPLTHNHPATRDPHQRSHWTRAQQTHRHLLPGTERLRRPGLGTEFRQLHGHARMNVFPGLPADRAALGAWIKMPAIESVELT